MNVYEVEFFAYCPTNGIRIKYQLEIETKEVIKAEDLIKTVSNFKTGFHEDYADQLIKIFGGNQTLIAWHHGVKITTIRS